jgi:uncharacterized protein (TIGR02118 family)
LDVHYSIAIPGQHAEMKRNDPAGSLAVDVRHSGIARLSHPSAVTPSCSRVTFQKSSEEEKLIKVSVLYPNTAGCKFDMDYYLNRHMPMVQQKLGPACKRIAVEEGIAGGAPGAPATYVALGHLYFDSTDAFQTAFAPHAQAIMADIPNYTDTQPTIQISEVKM